LAKATAVIQNGTITNFNITNPGTGYSTAPTCMLDSFGNTTPLNGLFVAATAPTARVGLYNLTYNFLAPAVSNVKAMAGVEIPSNNRINILTLGSTVSSTSSAKVMLQNNLD
jgi:hypothetical protein